MFGISCLSYGFISQTIPDFKIFGYFFLVGSYFRPKAYALDPKPRETVGADDVRASGKVARFSSARILVFGGWKRHLKPINKKLK